MCRVDDGEQCDVWNERERVARRKHTCSECRRTIASKERYLLITWFFDKGWGTTKLCAHCRTGAEWLRIECDGFEIDGVRDEILEHAQEYRSFALYRWRINSNRKWMHNDGLLPVPKLSSLHAQRG